MPPKVLIFGLPRTGTQSLADALMLLGYPKVYHMREVAKHNDHPRWNSLIRAKLSGQDPTDEELYEILHDWDALADFPTAIFGTQLIKAYPEAKVIITTRSEDSWVASMNKTLMDESGSPQDIRHTMRWAFKELCWKNDFDKYGRQYWREYRKEIEQALEGQEERKMVFELGDGWDGLCAFLGVDVPGVPFPNKDDWRQGPPGQTPSNTS